MANKKKNTATIQMPVRARHFKDTNFINIYDCAIARAAQEYFGVSKQKVNEGVNCLRIEQPNNTTSSFIHDRYGDVRYANDSKIAAELQYDDSIIFNLELTPYEDQ